ncbi:MAG: glycosyltransferase [Caulobacteraceae bacterium]
MRTEPVLKVGFLGSRRLEKGVDLHARLLGAVLKSRLPIQVLVQRHRPNAPGDPLDAFKSHPRVRLVDGWMTDAAMAELVQSLDAVMLPYDPARYGAMVSGVFTLAAGYGKPCVVPAGTWMAERIEAGEAAGVIYGRFGGDSMMAALQSLCDNIELYADQAADLAERWRRNYSADALVDRMMRWAEIPPRAAPPPPVMTREPELAQAR